MNTATLAAPAALLRRIQRLPFDVRPVADDADLAGVVALRRQAYERHLPGMGSALAEPEPADRCPHSLLLVATARAGSEVIGTLRLQSNRPGPLMLESSLELPAHVRRERLFEAGRLCIAQGAPHELRWALLKAAYHHALEAGAHRLMAVARRAMARIYESLLFEDLLEPGATYRMNHVGGAPHRVMGLRVAQAEQRWRAHPMRTFMVDTWHPEIRWRRSAAPMERVA